MSKIVLKDAIKTYTYDQDKVISPKETVKQVKHKFKDINLDILRKTKRTDSGRLSIPVFMSICGIDAIKTTGSKRHMGKGATPKQAEASALMELVERYSLFNFIKSNYTYSYCRYKNIKNKTIPFKYIAFSVNDVDTKLAKEVFSEIPLSWVPAYNLTKRREIFVPIDWFYAINEYNGSAAGNTLEEAIIQGLCEVIERHVCAIISDKKSPTLSIDVKSIKNPVALELIKKYIKNGINLFIKDFSLDMGIPTMGALAYDPNTFPYRSEIVFTAGTHTSPEKALIRALTEVAQLAGDFDTDGKYIPSGLPKPANLDEVSYITHHKNTINISELPNVSHPNIKKEIENCVEVLSKKGLEVIVVNITHPLIGIPAVYVIIPGTLFRQRAKAASVPFFSAKLASQLKDIDKAISILKGINSIYKKYYVYFHLGMCYLRKEKHRQALTHFKKALDLNPEKEDIPIIYLYIGLCYKNLNSYKRAIVPLKRAIAHDPQIKEVYNLLGFCYFKLKEYQKSIENFSKVVALDPSSAIDYANIASNLKEMGRIKEAIRFYRLALELEPNIDFAKENLKKLTKKKVIETH